MRRFLQCLGVCFLMLIAQQAIAHHTPHKHAVAHHRRHHVVQHRRVHRPKPLPIVQWAYIKPNVLPAEFTPPPLDVRSVRCLTQVILLEARGEPLRGQIAVANVVMHRARNPRYPNSVCGVVHQSYRYHGKRYCQFSWVCHPVHAAISPAVRAHAIHLAELALQHRLPDVVPGALSFHVTHLNTHWRGYTMVIGRHVFFSPTPYLASETHEQSPVSERALAL